jgi:branched-chain amino acid transport system permease protein
MNGERDIPAIPERPDARDVPRIGVDEWVATAEGLTERAPGWRGDLERVLGRVPGPARLAAFAAVASLAPFFLGSGDLFRYGLFTALYALLALGLNVTVGFAGLLDLGYIAFYGFGAYSYAILASPHYDWHVDSAIAIPVVVAMSAVLGLLLGLPSRRLLGDYLAIVTLFFGQAFVTFVNNANPRGLTGGANGIADIDPFEFFGWRLESTRDYYWFSLGAFVVVIGGLWSLSRSRIGRAWKSLREDPLAAELMGMPVNRLKLLAFVFGASIAGLTGCIFAAVATGVASGAFDVSLLILIYAIVILGGAGSLTGVVIGAIVINVSFEILTPATPGTARILFYAAIIAALLWKLRPWQKLAAVLAGVAVFGLVAHAIASAVSDTATEGAVEAGGRLGGVIDSWVVIPASSGKWPEYGYIALVVMILAVSRLAGWWRLAALVPTLYLVAFVWENLLVLQPAVTRLILFGALLITLMSLRPQGLLGTSRVEIV